MLQRFIRVHRRRDHLSFDYFIESTKRVRPRGRRCIALPFSTGRLFVTFVSINKGCTSWPRAELELQRCDDLRPPLVGCVLEGPRIEEAVVCYSRRSPGGIPLKGRIKIPRAVLEIAIADLRRPHAFASERIGFFSTRCSIVADGTLLHCVDYHPVDDAHYVLDQTVGARIGSEAIREAMARCASRTVGQLHVHTHGGSGLPRPSGDDQREIPVLARSLHNVDRNKASGWLILSEDDAWSSIFLRSEQVPIAELPVSIVGYPMTTNRGAAAPKKARRSWRGFFGRRKDLSSRYVRQSFLGQQSERTFSQTCVGIIGLGGGGSHVVQQLSHLGFSKLILCDAEIIDDTNLNRTVGATDVDVRRKRLKVAIAERNVRELLRNAKVVTHPGKWETAADKLMFCDVIIGCIDSFIGRRDLEAFCRRHMIPYIDVGMDVKETASAGYEIFGQVILSMPGRPCMHCMGFLTDDLLAEEARAYGVAGGRPQVVWANGALSSAAVGIIVDLVTGWSQSARDCIYLNFVGSTLSIRDDRRMPHLTSPCLHYSLLNTGDPTWARL
jgi:hypothetical protein